MLDAVAVLVVQTVALFLAEDLNTVGGLDQLMDCGKNPVARPAEMRIPVRRSRVVQRGVLHARQERAVLRDRRVGDLQGRVAVARDADSDIGGSLGRWP